MRNPARLRIAALSMFPGVAMMSLQVGGFAMAHDNEIVNTNILTRVLHLKIGEMTGTAFTVEVDGRQYLITAKHLTGESGIEELEIWQEGWHKLLGSEKAVWKIAGIISGYQIEGVNVRDQAGRIIGSAEGNSGILVATGIETALKLIETNPIGFPVARE